jgi:DNA-directed RNA polymerase specialized sigma24 family protein
MTPTRPDLTDARFATTAWSRVLRANAPDPAAARLALGDLCRAYWYPLYAFHRRRGASAADAEDSVQGFFTWLIESQALSYVDRERGRFRGFLVAAFRQFLAKQNEYATATKRCPAEPILSIDSAAGEARYALEPVTEATPDQLFEYAWAVAVLGRAMDRLRAEQVAAGRGDRFEAFQGMLTGQSDLSAREAGMTLGMTEGAVRVALLRLRERYRDLLREEVGATLDEGEDVESEMRQLLTALRSARRV